MIVVTRDLKNTIIHLKIRIKQPRIGSLNFRIPKYLEKFVTSLDMQFGQAYDLNV